MLFDIILLIIFCYQLYRVSVMEGVSLWPYLLNYITAYVLLMIAVAYALLHFYGIEALKTEQGVKAAMMFEPIIISFEVFLFIYFRKRMQKLGLREREDDNYHSDNDPPKKKDLSYFR